jgi:hypothetical protein
VVDGGADDASYQPGQLIPALELADIALIQNGPVLAPWGDSTAWMGPAASRARSGPYPYHQGKSGPAEVKQLLTDMKEIEVRVLPLP